LKYNLKATWIGTSMKYCFQFKKRKEIMILKIVEDNQDQLLLVLGRAIISVQFLIDRVPSCYICKILGL
jgi:hypothetical protein